MPRKPCLTCRQVTTTGSRCPTCEAKRLAIIDAQRGTSTQRGYGSQWRTKSRRVRAEGRRCVYCGATSDLTTDHRVPKVQGGTDDRSNLVVACRSCNSSKGGR